MSLPAAAGPAEVRVDRAPAASSGLDLAPPELLDSASLAPAELQNPQNPQNAQNPPLRRSIFSIKTGYLSTQDTNKLDDGYIINASFTDFFSPHFAVESEFGYLDASGKDAGLSTDVWGLPFLINGRLNFPAGRFDLYGGIGFGSIYYEVSTTGSHGTRDGWTFAGDGFLGASMNLTDTLVLGLEGKYYLTEKINALDGGLDAFALMLTLGFRR
jgi:hypothetical protein